MDTRQTGLGLFIAAGTAFGLLADLQRRAGIAPFASIKLEGEVWLGAILLLFACTISWGLATYRQLGGELVKLILILIVSVILGVAAGEIAHYWPK